VGYESDKLVYDYLGRVGDLAQAASMSAAERVRLVARVRAEIDSGRSQLSKETPATVRRLLKRVGSAEDVVRAAERGGPEAGAAAAALPGGPHPEVPVGVAPPVADTASEGDPAPSAGASVRTGDWWRLPDESTAAVPDGPRVPAMRGPAEADFGVWDRIELDFDLEEEEEEDEEEEEEGEAGADEDAEEEGADGEADGEPAEEEPAEPRRRLLRFRRGPSRASGPLLVLEALAALLLAAGAVLGLWYLAVLGWFAAYGSVRLGQTMRKFVAIGVPVVTVLGGFAWLWARSTGHWGTALTHPQFVADFRGMWPVLLRVGAGASSALLAWLIYRQRRYH
jgi:hypothetical protein